MMQTPRDPYGRARLTAAALLVTVFLAGALTGAAVVPSLVGALSLAGAQSLDMPSMPPPAGHGMPFPRPDAGERFSNMLAARLDLTEAQHDRIRTILLERRSRMDTLMLQLRPALRDHLDSVRDEIRVILTPDQRQEWDRFEAERREYMMRGLRGGSGAAMVEPFTDHIGRPPTRLPTLR